MRVDPTSLPLADKDREDHAAAVFPLSMSPEEYAARHAHHWMAFSFDDYRYGNDELTRWIHRLGDILFRRHGAPSVEELRRTHLSPDERRRIESEIESQSGG